MNPVADFPAKLDLMLKVVSLSRVALAQRMAVDKSLVGRWLAGSVHPSEHNLTRLSTILAHECADFRHADWFEDLPVLAHRHGVEVVSPAQPATAILPAPLAAFLEAAGPELAFRGPAYEGFWRTSRPSLLMRDHVFHDYGMIRRAADGMVEVHIEGSGLAFGGWLFPAAGNLFVFLFDSTGRTPMSLVFKGVSLPKAQSMEGILLLAALDSDRTPAAMPILIERVGDLTGDSDADLARFHEIITDQALPLDPIAPEEVARRLYRDTGPAAALAGGEMFLSVASAQALSRGETGSGLSG